LEALESEATHTERDRSVEPVLAARDVSRRGGIQKTSVELFEGEVVGFAGLLGSGRTELARLLYGADKTETGQIRYQGKKVELKDPVAGLMNHIAYSTENRRDEGIVGDLTVRENMILAAQAKRGWAKPLSRKEQNEIVDRYMGALNVRPPDPERPIKNLSGGNQQKVLLARWLATEPDLLILDEPTRGIDVGAKAEIQESVTDLAKEGVTVIFISSELDEVVRLSERIVVLKDQEKIGEIVNGPGVSAQDIVDLIASDSVEESREATGELAEGVEA